MPVIPTFYMPTKTELKQKPDGSKVSTVPSLKAKGLKRRMPSAMKRSERIDLYLTKLDLKTVESRAKYWNFPLRVYMRAACLNWSPAEMAKLQKKKLKAKK